MGYKFHPLENYKVLAMGAETAKSFCPKVVKGKSSLLIRIVDSEASPLPVENLYEEVLVLKFLDIDLGNYEEDVAQELQQLYGDQLFTKDLAKQVIHFLTKYNKDDLSQIVVHCSAGVSRSVAIAYFISKYYLKDSINVEAILNCDRYLYGGNSLVRKLLEELWHEETGEEIVPLGKRKEVVIDELKF